MNLFDAAASGDLDTLRALLDAGADINQAFDSGMTALLTAANHANLDTIQTLLEGGANPLARSINGHTALTLAVLNNTPKYGQLEAMRLFIEAGVDINATTQWGTSAHSLALERKMEDKLAFLRAAGAAPNTTESPWMKKAAVVQPKEQAAPQSTAPSRHPWWQFWR